jgi:hypothetical protein
LDPFSEQHLRQNISLEAAQNYQVSGQTRGKMAAVAKPVRARALDHQRPMMIFRGDEDKEVVAESTAIARTVSAVPTGMEKAEEEVGTVFLSVFGFFFVDLLFCVWAIDGAEIKIGKWPAPAHNQEHHIQAALSTQQLSGSIESALVIPVPESVVDQETEVGGFAAMFVCPAGCLAVSLRCLTAAQPDNRTFKMPKQYIRVNCEF